jgi:hypothetical protein
VEKILSEKETIANLSNEKLHIATKQSPHPYTQGMRIYYFERKGLD